MKFPAIPAVLLTMACATGQSPAPAAGRPNILLIVVDTMRKDHLGCYGYDRDITPNMDALAARAVRYQQAVSQAPWTTPSIGALMASRYPTELGVLGSRSILSQDLVLLAESLRASGYRTQGVVSHTFCSAQWNFHQGFEQWDENSIVRHNKATSPDVSEEALRFLNDGDTKNPFFMWLHYFDPHGMYLLHPEFDPTPEIDYQGVIRQGLGFWALRELWPSLTPADVEQVVRAYDSEIGYTDHYIGIVLDRLRELDIYDNTLIILTADHGEAFGDHGTVGHDDTLYRELLDVPLLVKYPGREPGTVAGPVALVDIYPTLLRELGLPLLEGMAGRPLPRSPLEDANGERILFAETSRRANLRAAVSSRFKLIETLPDGTHEFYDRLKDPEEKHNLAPSTDPEFARLRQALAGWLDEMAKNAREETTADLSDENLRRLRSLGYVGDDGD